MRGLRAWELVAGSLALVICVLGGYGRPTLKPIKLTLSAPNLGSGKELRVLLRHSSGATREVIVSSAVTTTLPTTGTYEITCSTPTGECFRTFVASFVGTENALAIPVNDTLVRLQIQGPLGEPPAVAYRIDYEGPLDQPDYQAGSRVIALASGKPFEILGWREGRYRVMVHQLVRSAQTGEVVAAGIVGTAELEKGAADTDVAVVTRRRGATLNVSTESGKGISTAQVYGELGRALPRLMGGGFSMRKTAPSDRVIVTASGYLPVCRTVGDGDGDVVVTLRTYFATAKLRLKNGQGIRGAVLGLPGSDCPVPLSALSVEADALGGENEYVMTLFGLPEAPLFFVVSDGRKVHRVEFRPGDDVTIEMDPSADSCGRQVIAPYIEL